MVRRLRDLPIKKIINIVKNAIDHKNIRMRICMTMVRIGWSMILMCEEMVMTASLRL